LNTLGSDAGSSQGMCSSHLFIFSCAPFVVFLNE